PGITTAALDLLHAYSWPGNVRELRNVIERAVLLSGARTLGPDSLPPEITDGAPSPETMETLVPPPPAASAVPQFGPPRFAPRETGSPERRRILEALQSTGGNRTRAAEILGMSRRTLANRIKEHGIPAKPRARTKDKRKSV